MTTEVKWGAWLDWDGSAEMPSGVAGDDPVRIEMRDGEEDEFRAAGWAWRHGGCDDDIIRYRLRTDHPVYATREPRTATRDELRAWAQGIVDNIDRIVPGMPPEVAEEAEPDYRCALAVLEMLGADHPVYGKVETVRVRIAVVVDKSGKWLCDELADRALDRAYRRLDFDVERARVVWVEADIPLPEAVTVQGEVSDG